MFDYDQRSLGRSTAVERNPLIGAARNAFMRSRLPYWEDWCGKRPGSPAAPTMKGLVSRHRERTLPACGQKARSPTTLPAGA